MYIQNATAARLNAWVELAILLRQSLFSRHRALGEQQGPKEQTEAAAAQQQRQVSGSGSPTGPN